MTRQQLYAWWATPNGFIASGFGSGLSTFAPGTMGTLVAWALYIVIHGLSPTFFWLLSVLGLVFGSFICQNSEKYLASKDASAIVIDEIIAFWLLLALVAPHWWTQLLAFILFRVFDIAKPWPIKILEQRLPGGIAIMADDLLAALYALILYGLIRCFV